MEEIDLENGTPDADVDEETKEELDKFYRETDAISKAIDRIHENVETIESRYQISLHEHLQASDKAIASNDIGRLLDQTERTSDAIRKRLRRIAGENKKFRAEHPEKVGTLRIRVNTHQNLTRRFMDAMQQFEESQEKHRDNVQSAMERQLRIMNPQATEEDIQDALRDGKTQNVVDESPTLLQLPVEEQVRLRNGLDDLMSRNNDIKKLEESIVALHQLFVDMQILVEAQGELLNDIEYNIGETKDKTETGYQELVEARAHQKSAGKKKICIVVLVIAIAAAILVPILLKYIPKWFPSTADAINSIPGVGGGTNGTDSTNSTSSAEGETNTEEGEAPSGRYELFTTQSLIVANRNYYEDNALQKSQVDAQDVDHELKLEEVAFRSVVMNVEQDETQDDCETGRSQRREKKSTNHWEYEESETVIEALVELFRERIRNELENWFANPEHDDDWEEPELLKFSEVDWEREEMLRSRL